MLSPHQALEFYYGHSEFRPAQLEIIEQILAGSNTLAILPTGSGKSICFQVPALILEGVTLIVSPLLSLISDQIDKLKQLNINVCRIDSTLSEKEYLENLKAIEQGDIKIVYTSPESLSNKKVYQVFQQATISLVAIDEAHCYSEWGHSFRSSYLSLPRKAKALRPHAIVALTATATRKVSSDIRKAFSIKASNQIGLAPTRDNLSYHILPTQDDQRLDLLVQILRQDHHSPAIVYAMKQEQCEEIASFLKNNNYNCRSYHAGMSSASRKQVQDAFLSNRVNIIVATIAFGMGVDKSDIRTVIHYHMPKSPEGWLQESGRAGRDGQPAHTYVLACGDDITQLNYYIQAKKLSKTTITRLLDHLFSQEQEIVIQPYHLRVNLDIDSSTLDALMAKLELMRLISYSHTTWRYAKISPLPGTPIQLHSYPKKTQQALSKIIDSNDRYDLTLSMDDFAIPTKKIYQTLCEIKQYSEMKISFSGWQKHYKISKARAKFTHEEIADKLYKDHQEQQDSSTARLSEVIRILKTKSCITAQLTKWFGYDHKSSCGRCSSCLTNHKSRKIPQREGMQISDEDIERIQQLLVKKGKRLNSAKKLTCFLCGISTPYNRHFFLYKDKRFGCLNKVNYEDVYALSQAIIG